MSRVHSSDGTAIAFDRYGGGPVVILVGGAFQHRAIDSSMARLAELLAQQFTVFHYDRRGRGDSEDTLPYAVEREVEDLEALIVEAGGSASVFGMSSGAALALEAAASGLDIEKMTFYEPPFMVGDVSSRPPEYYVERLNELVSAGHRGDAVEFFMTKVMGMPTEAVAPVRDAPVWPELKAVAHTLVYDLTIMGDASLPVEQAASVTAPTLVIAGGASSPFLRETARALADALPEGRHRTLEGQTHEVDPEVLAPVLKESFAG